MWSSAESSGEEDEAEAEEEDINPRLPAARDSFDRYGDDMAAQILGDYPPVSDMIRWQEVSKQFRMIGADSADRIERLELTEDQLIRPLVLHQCRHSIGGQQPQCRTLTDKFCRHIMQRYPQIKSIDLKSIPINNTMTEIVAIIVANRQQWWPHLMFIDGLVFGYNPNELLDIIIPVQQLFRQLDVSMIAGPKPWLREFHRLEELNVRHIVDIVDENNELVVNGLLGFRCIQMDEQFVDLLEIFLDGNRGLRRLAIDSLWNSGAIPPTQITINQSLTLISRLTSLQQLSVQSRQLTGQSMGQPLALIAGQCRQLRQFTMRFGYTINMNVLGFVQTIRSLKQMNRLQWLSVTVLDGNVVDDNTVRLAEQQLSSNMQSGLQITPNCWPELRQLILTGKMLALVANQQFFQQIHQTLPRLQSLEVDTNWQTVIDGRSCWQSLAQLSRLERLIITGPVLNNLTKQKVLKWISKYQPISSRSSSRSTTKLHFVRLAIHPTPSTPVLTKITDKMRSMFSNRQHQQQPQQQSVVEVIEFNPFKDISSSSSRH